ncbi:hypothetical protein AC629_09790 [Bradyrhizobium sp. NAS80.1]|nr:hypothetical protein AC629_09790 [Bradyrhizobium sp. NAS80.1]
MNKTIQTVESAAGGGAFLIEAFLIEDVYPLIDSGRFAVKRIAGERVEVWADIYRDGDAVASAALIWREEQNREWQNEPMIHHGNDRWSGSFTPAEPGQYIYAIEAWTDEFATWSHGVAQRHHVTALENLLTGEQSRIEWGGIRLYIDPDRDPALLFRCLA